MVIADRSHNLQYCSNLNGCAALDVSSQSTHDGMSQICCAFPIQNYEASSSFLHHEEPRYLVIIVGIWSFHKWP